MTGQSRKKQNMLLVTTWLLMILVAGCYSTVSKYTRPDIDLGKIKKVAVLPIENFTSDEYAHEKIRSLLIIDLLSRGIDVIEPGEVIKTLRELRVWSVNSLSASDIRNIAKILKVEAVMTGSVGTFKVRRGVSVSYPEVSLSLMLYEATSGNVVWSVWHTSGGASFFRRHFGAENITLDGTSRNVIKGAIDTLY
jgi:TolB-like protein